MPCAGAMDNVCMRTLLFFLDNPDEVLTGPDMRAKFGVRMRNLPRVLGPLIDRGLVAYTTGGGRVPGEFSAGPKLRARGAACASARN